MVETALYNNELTLIPTPIDQIRDSDKSALIIAGLYHEFGVESVWTGAKECNDD